MPADFKLSADNYWEQEMKDEKLKPITKQRHVPATRFLPSSEKTKPLQVCVRGLLSERQS